MKFIKQFEDKVIKTIKEYDLISPYDKVLVAYSGGKDSTTTLYLLNKFGFKVEALMINLLMGDYSERHLANAEKFCNKLGIKLNITNIRNELGQSVCYIRSGIQAKNKLSNCLICGTIKRWLLNKKAHELKATKLATGHNLDDESETLLMNLFGGNPKLIISSGPKNGLIKDELFVQRIKPLYFCTNDEVRNYARLMDFPIFDKPCPCRSDSAFRSEIRKDLTKLSDYDPKVKTKLINSFLRLLPDLINNYSSPGKLNYCKLCGEPSRQAFCKKCSLINILKN